MKRSDSVDIIQKKRSTTSNRQRVKLNKQADNINERQEGEEDDYKFAMDWYQNLTKNKEEETNY
jgi:hypothetical protein